MQKMQKIIRIETRSHVFSVPDYELNLVAGQNIILFLAKHGPRTIYIPLNAIETLEVLDDEQEAIQDPPSA